MSLPGVRFWVEQSEQSPNLSVKSPDEWATAV